MEFDFITIGGAFLALLFVIISCFIIYKMLGRETTFEEAYGNSNIKLLNNLQISDKPTTKGKKKHHKRKQSPKNDHREKGDTGDDKKDKVDPEVTAADPGPSADADQPQTKDSVEKQQQEKPVEKIKFMEIAETPKQEKINLLKSPSVKVEDIKSEISANIVEEQTKSKKAKKQVVMKDLNLPKVVDRLKEIGELEPEYLTFLQGMTEETKAKENKLRSEIKEQKSEKNDLEKKLKKSNEDFGSLQNENIQLKKEKKEQNDRHILFEQTVRNKMMETHQQKEENKKLTEKLTSTNSHFLQMEQQFAQKVAMLQAEVAKAREERDVTKNYADKLVTEMRKTEDAVRGSQMGFERQAQTLQAELNSEREQRINREKEFITAKALMEKAMTEMANKENQLHGLQNELKHEKDHNRQAARNAQNQIAELTREVERAVFAFNNLMDKHGAESAKNQELNARIKELEEEIIKIQQSQQTVQNGIDNATNQKLSAQNKDLEQEINRMKEQNMKMSLEHKEAEHSKNQELFARNKELEQEISRMKQQNANTIGMNSQKLEELEKTIIKLTQNLEDQRAHNQDLRDTNSKLLESVKEMESKSKAKQMTATNGTNNSGADDLDSTNAMQRIAMENKNYKITLATLNKQLEDLQRVASEMEREKDIKIQHLEQELSHKIKV